MGTAHAGHDQCAHCYFQFVKPVMQAERQAVKGRRAIKRAMRRGGGVLGNQAEQPGGTLGYLKLEHRDAIQNAITDIELDGLLDGKTGTQQLEAVTHALLKREFPVTTLPRTPMPKEEPQPEPEPHVGKRHVHRGDSDKLLTAAEVQEVMDAYRDGMFVNDICNACDIVTTTLYNIVREAGIPLRTHTQNEEQAARARRRWAPQEVVKVSQSTTPVLNGKVAAPPPNGVVSGLTEWTVTYTVTRTESTIVQAKGFSEAAAAVAKDGIEVISVAKH
jgi:hypothetical protein